MKIPILEDLTKKIASDYGVLNADGVAFRGTFVIDPKVFLVLMDYIYIIIAKCAYCSYS